MVARFQKGLDGWCRGVRQERGGAGVLLGRRERHAVKDKRSETEKKDGRDGRDRERIIAGGDDDG